MIRLVLRRGCDDLPNSNVQAEREIQFVKMDTRSACGAGELESYSIHFRRGRVNHNYGQSNDGKTVALNVMSERLQRCFRKFVILRSTFDQTNRKNEHLYSSFTCLLLALSKMTLKQTIVGTLKPRWIRNLHCGK